MMPIVNFFRSSFAIGPPIDTDAFPPTCMQPYCAPRPKGAISIAPSVGSLPSLEFRLILRLLILALMGAAPELKSAGSSSLRHKQPPAQTSPHLRLQPCRLYCRFIRV